MVLCQARVSAPGPVHCGWVVKGKALPSPMEINQGPHSAKRRNSLFVAMSEVRWDDIAFIMAMALMVGVILGYVLREGKLTFPFITH